ncbi:hypothetical protein CEN39_26125, partial [Fischerella thermalis CCMEE 5201]
RWGTRGPHSPKGVGIRGNGEMGSVDWKNDQYSNYHSPFPVPRSPFPVPRFPFLKIPLFS